METVEDSIRIFRSNAEVDTYNSKVLTSLNTEGATANAYDFCISDRLPSLKEKVLNNVQNIKTTETFGLPLKIDLKVNSDNEDGLVNSACGKLAMIDHGKLKKLVKQCHVDCGFNSTKKKLVGKLELIFTS